MRDVYYASDIWGEARAASKANMPPCLIGMKACTRRQALLMSHLSSEASRDRPRWPIFYLSDHLRLSTRPATLAETPRVSTWLRQIYCEALEIAKRAMDQGTIVGGTQDHPGRLVCIESFLPAGRT